jgi:hypothetical protein
VPLKSTEHHNIEIGPVEVEEDPTVKAESAREKRQKSFFYKYPTFCCERVAKTSGTNTNEQKTVASFSFTE